MVARVAKNGKNRTGNKSEEESGSTIEFFWPHEVRPMPGQPRKRFRGIPQLAKSIKQIGQTTPGIVRYVSNDLKYKVELIDGERRLRACTLAGVKFRAEIVANPGDLKRRRLISLASNFQKQDHDTMEIADSLAQSRGDGYSVDELADACGMSVGWVRQHLTIYDDLDDGVKAMLIPDNEEDEADTEAKETSPKNNGHSKKTEPRRRLTFSLAVLLTSAPRPMQLKLSKEILKHGMSLAAARRFIVREMTRAGHTTKRPQTAAEQYDSLLSLVDQMKDRFGIFDDMRGEKVDEILSSAERESLVLLGETMKDLSGSIDLIAEKVNNQVMVIDGKQRKQRL